MARRRLRETLTDRDVAEELTDTVVLLASELVTNAVLHCRVSCAQVRVTLTLDGTELVLEVTDPDRDRLPRSHRPALGEEGRTRAGSRGGAGRRVGMPAGAVHEVRVGPLHAHGDSEGSCSGDFLTRSPAGAPAGPR
ncbi:hypothetical protein SHIRM173S_12666 [Streptomyces hirsutus]